MLLRVRRGRNPFGFASPLSVDGHVQHLAMVRHLRDIRCSTIVIAASGMCAGGRIVDYLKEMRGTTCCSSAIRPRVRWGR